MEYNQKINVTHLKRRALLYIRQSTMKQVYENNESTIRQYALKERLVALGWQEESITIIDCDLGRSGAETTGRDGFKQLVADVGAGEAGAVACIECSRLSRNSNDWGRLMEICAITKTLLIDADGIYDPNDFNDRILLGLKGTINMAELYLMKARMDGGRINKAQRGELKVRLPAGYVYDSSSRIVKDPDAQIQGSVQLVFDSFRRFGSAHGVMVFFRENGYKFPVDSEGGFNRGNILWKPLEEGKICTILHNPLYAGIYTYGKQQQEYTLDGKKTKKATEDEWLVRLENHHDSYINVDEYYHNIARLKANNTRKYGSAPREGSALLQGISLCGKCGQKMMVSYYNCSGNVEVPYYVCTSNQKGKGAPRCQSIHGTVLDNAISIMILEMLTPMAINAAAEIEQEANRRKAVSDNYFIMQVERARYELENAKRRYMNVDPSNRLVAFELERLWNAKIIELSQAEEELNRHNREKESARLNNPVSIELGKLSDDVNEIWNSGKMRIQDKKRIFRCLIENVTLTKGNIVTTLGILFKTGATRVIECKTVRPNYEVWTTKPEVINYIRLKSTTNTTQEISNMLNQDGYKTGKGGEFTLPKVRQLMVRYGIPSLKAHLREKGYIYSSEKAAMLGISQSQLGKLRQYGAFNDEFFVVDEKSTYMYAPV